MDYDRHLFKRIAEALEKSKPKRRCKFCKTPHDMETNELVAHDAKDYTDGMCDKALAEFNKILKEENPA